MNPHGAAPADITPLLTRWSQGDRDALDHVLPLVYVELKGIAARQLRKERGRHSLEPADLVHALFLQFVVQRHATWSNRAQFLATATQMMHRMLVEHARARLAAKRGGSTVTVSLSALTSDPASRHVPLLDVVAVDQALERLAEHDADRARIVRLRFLAGFSVEEAAHAMGSSARTIKREWRLARAWLLRELGLDGDTRDTLARLQPKATLGAASRGEDAEAVVVPQGVDADTGARGECPDA